MDLSDEARKEFVRPDLLPERLADWIRAEIIRGRFQPGERLVEKSLANEYRVSRVPLREALRIVAADGLVTLAPHRGASVTHLSDTELVELFELRMALEGYAAGAAARNMPAADLAALRDLSSAMSASVAQCDFDAYHSLADRFHSRLVAAGGNTLLCHAYERLRVRFRRYQAAMAHIPGLPTKSLEEHAGILEAIEAGDAPRARRLAEEHIGDLVQRFRARRKSRETEPAAP